MSYLLSDPTAITIMTESDLSNIISNFDYTIVLDIIEQNIHYRYNAANSLSNLPAACELTFKEQLSNMGEGSDASPYISQLQQLRDNTYRTIIDIVCSKFGFGFHDTCFDIYTAAFTLYNLLISDFRNTISNFYANYIISEMNGIYDAFGIARFKKQKDSTTLYNKRSYSDQKLGLIVSNLNFVLDNMKNFDIPFEFILNYVYKSDPKTAEYIRQNFICNVDFYKNIIVPVLESEFKSILITDIRIKIDSVGIIHRSSILDIQQSNTTDGEEE